MEPDFMVCFDASCDNNLDLYRNDLHTIWQQCSPNIVLSLSYNQIMQLQTRIQISGAVKYDDFCCCLLNCNLQTK